MAGTTSRTLPSPVVSSVSRAAFAVTVALAAGPVTLSVTSTARGEFDAPLALMVILPLYVPGLRPEASTDALTVTLACGPFDDADRGEKDSQLADDDRENGMSVCRTVFHTSNVWDGAPPPRSAVNVSRPGERSASGRTSSGVGVAVGVGVGVTVGAGPPLPPSPPLPPPIGVAVGGVVGVGVGVTVGVAVAVGVGVGGGELFN